MSTAWVLPVDITPSDIPDGTVQVIARATDIPTSVAQINAVPFLVSGKVAIITGLQVIISEVMAPGDGVPFFRSQINGSDLGNVIYETSLSGFRPDATLQEKFSFPVQGKNEIVTDTATSVLEFEITATVNSGFVTVEYIGYYQ